MDQNATEETKALKNGVELVRTGSDKHIELLRPSARYLASKDYSDREKGKYTLIRDVEDHPLGLYDKPLPCFGCGIGWFTFLLGFLIPILWYYATFLYFWNYRKDPRERAGLAASAIAALICTVGALIIGLVLMFH